MLWLQLVDGSYVAFVAEDQVEGPGKLQEDSKMEGQVNSHIEDQAEYQAEDQRQLLPVANIKRKKIVNYKNFKLGKFYVSYVTFVAEDQAEDQVEGPGRVQEDSKMEGQVNSHREDQAEDQAEDQRQLLVRYCFLDNYKKFSRT